MGATTPRWRVAIVDDHERSRVALRGAIAAAGGAVAGEALLCADAVPLIERTTPDVAIFAVGLPDGDGIEAASHAIARTACPVVLFTSHTDVPLVARARGGPALRPSPAALAGRLGASQSRSARQSRSSTASMMRSRWLHQIQAPRFAVACQTGVVICQSAESR